MCLHLSGFKYHFDTVDYALVASRSGLNRLLCTCFPMARSRHRSAVAVPGGFALAKVTQGMIKVTQMLPVTQSTKNIGLASN